MHILGISHRNDPSSASCSPDANGSVPAGGGATIPTDPQGDRPRATDPGSATPASPAGTTRHVGPWRIDDRAPADLEALLALGVRPTCLDAAALHGLWVPPSLGAVHVFRPRIARGARVDPDTTQEVPRAAPIRRRNGRPVEQVQKLSVPLLLHGPALRSWPSHDPVPDLPLALDHAARCLPTVQAAILFESALERRRLRRNQAERIIAGLPFRARRDLTRIRDDAGSGTETRVRWWFEARRVRVRSQVVIPGVGRVDLVVGSSWVIECDSREFHDSDDAYERDRTRDLALRTRGYVVTRLTWKQVFLAWADTEARLLAALRRGEHLRPAAA